MFSSIKLPIDRKCYNKFSAAVQNISEIGSHSCYLTKALTAYILHLWDIYLLLFINRFYHKIGNIVNSETDDRNLSNADLWEDT